jgi:hypothetical protein
LCGASGSTEQISGLRNKSKTEPGAKNLRRVAGIIVGDEMPKTPFIGRWPGDGRGRGVKRHIFIDRRTSLSKDLLISKRLLNIKLYGVSNYLKGV